MFVIVCGFLCGYSVDCFFLLLLLLLCFLCLFFDVFSVFEHLEGTDDKSATRERQGGWTHHRIPAPSHGA